MSDSDLSSFLKGRRRSRPKPVVIDQDTMVTLQPLLENQALPTLVKPKMEGLSLPQWASVNRAFVESELYRRGALLFRGFNPVDIEAFNQFVVAVGSEAPLAYRDRTTPRSEVVKGIYTATDFPPENSIFQHNEGTYWRQWPAKLFFYCVIAPETGGATPISNTRNVYLRIPEPIRTRFEERHWMLVRNYGDGLGLPWQEVFQTQDPAEVEAFCREADIVFEWKKDNRLRTRQVRPAVACNPNTGEKVWFNHATFFHSSSLDTDVREAFLREFGDDGLPYNTCYGDGQAIPDEEARLLHSIYEEETVSFPWQEGDVMLLDNMTIAHGRLPFTGRRKVLVAMTDPISLK